MSEKCKIYTLPSIGLLLFLFSFGIHRQDLQNVEILHQCALVFVDYFILSIILIPLLHPSQFLLMLTAFLVVLFIKETFVCFSVLPWYTFIQQICGLSEELCDYHTGWIDKLVSLYWIMVKMVKALWKTGRSFKSVEKFWKLKKKLRNVMKFEGHVVYVEWCFLVRSSAVT